MPRRSDQRDSGGLRQRLVALAGLVIMVGGTVTALLAAGLLGNQGGGEGIEDVLLLEPASNVRQDLGVGPERGELAGSHPVAVGDDSELNWRGMLDSILPTRHRVSKGFAIDADGKRSDQIDILIYDRHFSPVLLDVGDYLFVPAEAVFAAIEVKQQMNCDTIMYATEKIASVRSLRRTSAPVPYVEGTYEPKPLQRETPHSLTQSQAEEALIFFVISLLRRLQGMASPPAIEYAAYSKALDPQPE